MGTTRQTLSIFMHANLKYPGLFWSAIASWAIGLILQKIVLPLITAQAINKLIAAYGNHIDYWHTFSPYIIAFGVVMVLAQILNDSSLWILSKLESRVRPELQMRIFDLLMNQSLNFHANNFSGSLVSQTNRFVTSYLIVTDLIAINAIMLFVTIGVAIIVTAYFLPLVALAMIVWTAFFVWLNITLTRRRMHLARDAAKADSELTAHLADAVGNIAAIKSFGREDDESRLHHQKAYNRAHKKYVSWMAATRNDFVFGLLMGVLQLVVLVTLTSTGLDGGLQLGTLLLVQVYITQQIGQLWSISGITKNAEQALSDANEMTELMGQELEIKDPAKPQKLRISKGEIAFTDVHFTHKGSGDALFSHFTLHIKPGEKVGLVGHSGSGKTTLTRLLLRFIDIDGGVITIDGQDITKIAQTDLRQHIAYVPQEPILFHRSLRDNIAYGKPNATDEEIEQAARMAHAADFIETLPHGYDTMVGERGVKLSGGQRQRIAIARAILKDAPILVLDEATSALDSESEKLIQDALIKLMHGRTTIVIAHRLSTVQSMDKIVVLESGAIAEQGTHAQLLAKPGVYASLWKHQSGGFLEE